MAIKRILLASVPGTLAEGTEVYVEDGSGSYNHYIGDSSNNPVLIGTHEFAELSGSANQVFNVGSATSNTHAVRKDQVAQKVILPEGNGATNDIRWYRVAEYSRGDRNSISLIVTGANRLLTTSASEAFQISVENLTNTDPVIRYSVINKASSSGGRVVVTNDGSTIGVYVSVGRYGDASVIALKYIIDSNTQGTLEATEIGQGSSVPAGISSDVVFNTSDDDPTETLSLGNLDVSGTFNYTISGRGKIGKFVFTESLGSIGTGQQLRIRLDLSDNTSDALIKLTFTGIATGSSSALNHKSALQTIFIPMNNDSTLSSGSGIVDDVFRNVFAASDFVLSNVGSNHQADIIVKHPGSGSAIVRYACVLEIVNANSDQGLSIVDSVVESQP